MSLEILQPERLSRYIDRIVRQNWDTHHLGGWLIVKDIQRRKLLEIGSSHVPAMTQALLLQAVCEQLPLSIREGAIFAGTEADAFSASYALINPAFEVKHFVGYNDDDAFYEDVVPHTTPAGVEITQEMIVENRAFWSRHPVSLRLREVYEKTGAQTREAVYFVERVTGHTLPGFEDALERGLEALIREVAARKKALPDRGGYFDAMIVALEAAMTLADRYSRLAAQQVAEEGDPVRKEEFRLIAETCRKVPRNGAENLYEALQSYLLLWQVMNLEQVPNPYAFSVGNLDRIMQPYYAKGGISEALAVQLMRHFNAFFEVGDRDWAISQNIIVGGSDPGGYDLTTEMTPIILEAFRQSNRPQPNLSVKLHPGTPFEMYRWIATFFFEFGHSTPSFLNDPVVFKALRRKGIAEEDLARYGVAGCQEPLIVGKESGNTTNTWLNLAKVLEVMLNNGCSVLTGEPLGPTREALGLDGDLFDSFEGFEKGYYRYLDYFIERMVEAGNACTEALSELPVPFASAFMGARKTGIDMRDCSGRGSPYNASGCLIHGLGTTADALTAIKTLFARGAESGYRMEDLIRALKANFEGYEGLRWYLQTEPPKYGNNAPYADEEAVELVREVSARINRQKNPFGASFAADWSSPSTNLLYGYWTGAAPDGRGAREPLSYGLDPAVGAATRGLLTRILSQAKLDYEIMVGGSAVAMSITPRSVAGMSLDEKAQYLKDVVSAVFGYSPEAEGAGLGYVYFNVFSPEDLLDVAEHPEKYPNPVIVRIHGQYGDARNLSPDILKNDIIPRLDPGSTSF